MKVLTIISHTEHYKTANGTIVGLGSTVTEINHLISVFDEIRHVAMLHNLKAPASALPYTSNKIRFIPIRAVGGKSLGDKFAIFWQSPKVLLTVRSALEESDYFQFRAPTGIGVYVIPYLMFLKSKKGLYKYAGNWKQEQAPLAYRFQKWLLEKQAQPVTINGFWDDQPEHCLSFENPCLTEQEIQSGQLTITSKTLQFPVELCFVGRLEAAKGVDLIIEALILLDEETRMKIGAIHFVGSGTQLEFYQKQIKTLSLPIVFHGYLSRAEVHDIYKRSHAILLPSASEGFPKVIAEALNYGCIPLVSNVSSVSHYITDVQNGFLMKDLTAASLKVCLLQLLTLEQPTYKQMASNSLEFINRFSYAYYNQQLLKAVL
jgi:glycosyltransferase involved in cell wall biosynthesis